MSPVNLLLKGTALTSTKNKYLDEEDINAHKQNSSASFKRKLTLNLLEDWKIIHEQNELTSTKNTLLDYDIGSKKKKSRHKRAKKEMQTFDSSPMRSQMLRKCPRKKAYFKSACREYEMEDTSVLADNIYGEVLSAPSMAQDCVLDMGGSGVFGQFNAMQMNTMSFAPPPPGLSAPSGLSAPPIAGFGCAPSPQHLFQHYQAPVNHSMQNSAFASSIPFGSEQRNCNINMLFNNFAEPSSRSFPFIQPPANIFEMPTYSFDSQIEHEIKKSEPFDFMDFKVKNFQLENVRCMKTKKMQFLNAASMALICTANLKKSTDTYRLLITKLADEVKAFDPEFILKVALYSRQNLNIRSSSNFLLSYAAYHEETRPYLKKYFEACIRLPSDWIEVAELYQVFGDERIKHRSLPAALKRVMVKSFTKFDAYQLAKYNRDKTKKKHKTKVNPNVFANEENEKCPETNYTLKQLISMLHIDAPAQEIMCLLGKKYPETDESFRRSGLVGIWNPQQAGKRMKLPQPITWETQISLLGNSAIVWEGLIDTSKLPYMAMLRNLKNLILSGISTKHHEKVLKQLENKIAVLNSRQLPLQFYEAFKVLTEIEELLNQKDSDSSLIAKDTPTWKIKRMEKNLEKMQNASHSLLERYKNGVSKAIEISALHNLQPIPGKSLVICDVLQPDQLGIKSNSKAYHLCVMMGLMTLKACEDCKMFIIYDDLSEKIALKEAAPFLKNMLDVCLQHEDMYQNMQRQNSVKALKHVLDFYLKQQMFFTEKLDHVIYLRTYEADSHIKKEVASFLHKYRQLVNPELLYTDVDFNTSNFSLMDTDSSSEKDVYLCGNTTQLIKFIAERSSGELLTCVENIDSKYNLLGDTDFKQSKNLNNVTSESEIIPVLTKVPKWHTVRIFISSTFKDMHSERDMLIRYVIPELRKRAVSLFVKINEVDLRWGITETDYSKNRTAELCLLEAQKSDLFIGILGDRYGTMYNFDTNVPQDLEWVKDCPQGLSITEFEMYAGALNEDKLKENKAMFYIRDNSFLSLVPEKWKSVFLSEDPESKQKVEALKSKILASGMKVFNGYPCNFAGILKDKPVLSDLDDFGKTVLQDLWNAVKEMHDNDPFADEIAEEVDQQQLLNSQDHFVESKKFPSDVFLKKLQKECGIFLISGTAGSGKTTFVVNMLQKLKNFSIVKFFIGLTPRSTDVSYMLQFICESIARYYPVSSMFPKMTKDIINQFPDILQEALNSSGGSNFILLIDGLDHLKIEDQMLDWLPLNLPQGLRLICTASDTSYAFMNLRERRSYGTKMHIESIVGFAQQDQKSIVRHYLKMYGKKLDESAFNNLMLQLVTKKDSGTPLYLRIACDFLRTYASFENFTTMLQSLPSSLPLLFKEIILQMENEYTPVLVQAALTLLCITTEGLDDADLHLLLSLAVLDKGKTETRPFNDILKQIDVLDSNNLLPKVTYCSLIHLICTFAYGHNRFKVYNLTGTEFEKAIMKFYLNRNFQNFATYMHCNMAAYYQKICDPGCDGLWKGRSGSAYRGLIHHLFNGKCYKVLFDNLCCLKFLEAAFSIGAEDFLLEYYSLLLKEVKSGNAEAKKVVDIPLLMSFDDFVSRNLHILQLNPHLVAQQAINEPSTSLVNISIDNFKLKEYHVVECVSDKTLDTRVATLGGFIKNITAAYLSSDDLAVLGSEDGYLKVLDIMSKKITRSFKSHSSTITFICFAGKDKICTASSDTTLNIWSIVDFSRSFVLKGHNHTVSCCCADLSSNILFSSGWDNSVRLWSLWDGRSISVIDEFRCPVNCLDHHPNKQQIACGLWNGSIELWDTVALKRMLVLSNDCRSVKSITYTTNGLNIVSTYMNSDIVIWSSEQGLKLSNLKGHVLPVRSICHSTTGDALVSGSEDCTLKVWSSESELPIHTISSCKICPISLMEIISANALAIGFQNSDIWVMDINNGVAISKMTLQFDTASCFSRINASYCDTDDPFENWTDTSLVFGTQSGQINVATFLTSSIELIGYMLAKVTAIIHNKRMVIFANSEGDIGIFSYLEKTSKIVFGAHERSVAALNLYLMDGNWCFISAGNDKVMKIWSVNCDEPDISLKYKYISKHSDSVTSCCWYASSEETKEQILTGSHDNNVILQKGDSKTTFKGLKTSVLCVDFSENYVVGCGRDGSVAVWFKDGKLLTYISGIDQSSTILSFRIDKDPVRNFDITLAFVDKDGSVKIRKPIQRSYSYSLEGHSKGITSCSINQDREVISCSLDGTVNLWKLPMDFQDQNLNHSTSVTDTIASESNSTVLSSDADGNIIIWELDQSSATVSLVYGTKKTYIGGYVKALSWLKETDFVCALTQTVAQTEVYFADIMTYKCNTVDGNKLYNLGVKFTHYFESEVLCLNASSSTETIVVALKSGDFIIITPNLKKKFRTTEDWILQAKLLQYGMCDEHVCCSLLNGSVKCFTVEDLLKCSDYSKTSFDKIHSAVIGENYFYTNTFCCESKNTIFCGDSKGWLRMYSLRNSPSFSKKVHEDSISGIVVLESYVFTTSLDKSLKGWNATTLEQVCLYYSPVSITSLAGFTTVSEASTTSFTLVIGLSSGAVQLLKFHLKK
ncbi:hypothetical protein JTE90_029160 [Oedothorax gibbosus]|uniref:TROVE domain-containing protein n=1 Tax=Oedothorax gibbosus TaxID=931172 RepID=A0AAV6VFR2_9ARAC|nr:hypothetical protein JTE90_029160 [Oedothorax gibbosus]